MLTRIVVGVVAALFAVGMLAIRFTPVFPIVVAFFAVMAAFELERVIGVKNKAIHIISLIFAGLIPLYYGFNHYLTERGIFIPALAVVILYILLLFILMITDYEHTKFEDVAAVVVASYFVPWGFSTLIMMRDVGVTYPDFAGRFFGKHKMAPNISPKKTIEGAVGGAFAGVLSSVILFLVFDSKYFTVHLFTWWEIAIISLILCVIGMCGDLSASVLKRNFGVKAQ